MVRSGPGSGQAMPTMDPLTLAMTKSACRAPENLMVPKEATWSDAGS